MNDVITHNSSVIFQFINFLLWTKGSYQIPNCDTFKWKCLKKICQISHVLFQITSQFFFKYCMTLQRHEKYFLCTSFTYFGSPLQCTFLRFSSAQRVLMSVLSWQFNYSSNLTSFIIVMAHNSPVNFKRIHFLLWIKGSHQNFNFKDFLVLWRKFAKFLMSSFKRKN